MELKLFLKSKVNGSSFKCESNIGDVDAGGKIKGNTKATVMTTVKKAKKTRLSIECGIIFSQF